MKKVFFAITVLFPSFMFGQNALNFPLSNQCPETSEEQIRTSTTPVNNGQRAVIWSEDFGNGFPSAWAIDDISGICPWVYSTDGSWGPFNGNNGVTAAAAINSTTSGNGFLICDPDSSNNANFGQPSSTNYQYLETYFATDAIDLTGFPNVQLEFEQAFRKNNDADLIVSVSNDSLVWTDYFVQGTVQNNASSANPDLVTIDISTIGGNQATVYLKIGWNTRVYYWMIDDLRITDIPNDDIAMPASWYDDYIEYHQYPQLQCQPLAFSGHIINIGANAQTNVQVNAAVVDPMLATVFNGTSAGITLTPQEEDTVTVTTNYTPYEPGNYSVHFTATQNETDIAPLNDSITKEFTVTDSIYARDNDTYMDQWNNGVDGNGDANEYLVGNLFEAINNDAATSVSVYLGTNTDTNANVFAEIYWINNGNFDFLARTNTIAVVDSMRGNFVTLPFTGAIGLVAGQEYIAVAGQDSDSLEVWVGRASNTSPDQTAFYWDGPFNQWYATTMSPMVRLNLVSTTSIDELDRHQMILSSAPNPFHAQTTISYTLQEPSDVTWEVRDITGKLIQHSTTRFMGVGQHQFQLNMWQSNAGIYFITVFANGKSATQKLVITP